MNKAGLTFEQMWKFDKLYVEEKDWGSYINSRENKGISFKEYKDGTDEFFITIYRTSNPIIAKWYYVMKSPALQQPTLPNVEIPEMREDLYPEDWTYKSRLAHEETYICGNGISSSCQYMVYWSRYGQYLVQIVFRGGDDNISLNEFERYIKYSDEKITKRLSQ